MTPTIVCFYAGILALFYIGLSLRIPLARRALRVSIGTGGSPKLERLVRAHGNFAEYAPMLLTLMLLLELRSAPPVLLHVCGILLVASRLAHAYGVSQEKENLRIRITAMRTTFALFLILGLMNIYFGLRFLLG